MPYHSTRSVFWLPRQPLDACAQAKCCYCGRYGSLGQCQSCGAPNVPVKREQQISEQIEVTTFGDKKRRYIAGMPANRTVRG